MRFALLSLSCCAFVTALSGEDTLGKWGGPKGKDKITYGGANIATGDVGGIALDGNIGDIGLPIGGGGGARCDPVACDVKVRCIRVYTEVTDTNIKI